VATNAIAAPDAASIMDEVITKGDLRNLTNEQRVIYYRRTCESLGLNPLTKPLDFINLSGKLVLYATKGATDQLRARHGISVRVVSQEIDGDILMVTVEGTDATGRVDTEIGAVTVSGLRGDALANARMKALTKAKRRLTLSMAGLGMMDETELETVPRHEAVRVDMETGEVIESTGRHVAAEVIESPAVPVPPPPPVDIANLPTRDELIDRLSAMARERGMTWAEVCDLAEQWVGSQRADEWGRRQFREVEERLDALPLLAEVAAVEEG